MAEELRLLVRKYIEGPKVAGRPLHLLNVMMVRVLVFMFVGFMRYDKAASILVHEECMVIGTDRLGPGFAELFVPKSKTDQTWLGSVLRIDGTGGQLCPVGLLWDFVSISEVMCVQRGPRRTVVLCSGPQLRMAQTGATDWSRLLHH
jgi:hypothetical protein